MSSGPENNFIASVHRKLAPIDQFYRMKNHNVYNGGIADCWYSGRRDLWVEYKWVDLPKRPDTVIDITAGKDPSLSVLQQEWLRGRVAEGRSCWVIVGHKAGGVIFKFEREWMRAWTQAEYVAGTRDRAEVAEQIAQHCYP
jgi:hypothetical protein